MAKKFIWLLWIMMLVGINYGAFTLASFSLFATSESTPLLSIDYLIALLIVLIANFVSIQTFIAIRHQQKKLMILGLIIGFLQAISWSLIQFSITMVAFLPVYLMITIIGFILLIISISKVIQTMKFT